MQGQVVGTALKVRGILSGLDYDVTYLGRKVNAISIKVHSFNNRWTEKTFDFFIKS